MSIQTATDALKDLNSTIEETVAGFLAANPDVELRHINAFMQPNPEGGYDLAVRAEAVLLDSEAGAEYTIRLPYNN
jgi:hypothetical protein